MDGNPSHNYLWNLEWTTQSQNSIHAIKHGLKQEPLGEQRSNTKWNNSEIHQICKMMEQGHKATYIYNYLKYLCPLDEKITYERVRTLVKHIRKKTHWKSISDNYNINTSKYDYMKEKSSVNHATIINTSVSGAE
nr:MAG TPA: hypothetical protein [Caudoviricetes sp.]